MREHHQFCDWHADQYPHECNCGAIYLDQKDRIEALNAEVARLREELMQLEVDAMEHYNDFSEWNFPREARNFAFDMAQFCRAALAGKDDQ